MTLTEKCVLGELDLGWEEGTRRESHGSTIGDLSGSL